MPNIELGYDVRIDQYNQAGRNTNFYTYKPYVKVKARFFKSFLLHVDYTHYTYAEEQNVLNTYGFLNAELSYRKKDAPFEYTLKTTNLLNNKFINEKPIGYMEYIYNSILCSTKIPCFKCNLSFINRDFC